jgi:hypothetical protein
LNFFDQHQVDLSDIKLELPFFNTINSPVDHYLTGELKAIIENVLFLIIEKYGPPLFSSLNTQLIKCNTLYSKDVPLKKDLECLKIKIRPTKENIEETSKILSSLFENNYPIKIRLDGNRTFSLVTMIDYLEKLELIHGEAFKQSIEYLEEPFDKFTDAFEFKTLKAYSVAIDESLINYKNHLDQLNLVGTHLNLILKPSLFGISKSIEIINWARVNQHNVIISSSYESKSAMRILHYLASLCPLSYHGLDTEKFRP